MAEKRLTKGQCRACSEVNDAERLYCNGCGEKLFEPCLACEAEIGVWDRFCGKCGANVADHIEARQQEYQSVFEQIDALCGETRPLDEVPHAESKIGWLADHLSKLRACELEASELVEFEGHPLFVQEVEQFSRIKKTLHETLARLEAQRHRFDQLKLHVRKIKLDDNVDLSRLAQITRGFNEYQICELVNEATQLAAQAEGKWVTMADFEEGVERVVAFYDHKDDGEELEKQSPIIEGEEQRLTKEIAEQFLADDDSVEMIEFTTISDAAAESLGKHEGRLWLIGLTSLSDAAAESLSKYRGEWLCLDGLASLSDAAAESLSKHKGDGLSLNVTFLSDAAVESLSKHKGDFLELTGLTNLSDAAAESLLNHEGTLSLNLNDLPYSAREILEKRPSIYDHSDDELDELADLLQELVEQPGAGLVHLKGMTKLETLSLIGPKITDAGLVHLKGLTGLQSLYLSGTKVTETGIADLQKVLPNCKISK